MICLNRYLLERTFLYIKVTYLYISSYVAMIFRDLFVNNINRGNIDLFAVDR